MTPIEDIARGIYLSVANKVAKMRLEPDIPTIMVGGVIAKHPYLKVILEKKFNMEILNIEEPQHIVSLGAALIAKEYYEKKVLSKSENTNIKHLAS